MESASCAAQRLRRAARVRQRRAHAARAAGNRRRVRAACARYSTTRSSCRRCARASTSTASNRWGSPPRRRRRCTELARKNNVRTVVGHQTHYEPAVLQMAELVREGYIGKPLASTITYFVSNHIAAAAFAPAVAISGRRWAGTPAFAAATSLERVIVGARRGREGNLRATRRLVPERANLDGGPPITQHQVDNLNYLLLRWATASMGTMQVCHDRLVRHRLAASSSTARKAC